MRKKTPLQLYMIAGLLLLFMSGMVFRLASVLQGDQVAAASVRQGRYHLHVPLTAGTFYDRNLRPMNNTEETVIAVVSPTPDTLASLFAKLRDREQVAVQLQHGGLGGGDALLQALLQRLGRAEAHFLPELAQQDDVGQALEPRLVRQAGGGHVKGLDVGAPGLFLHHGAVHQGDAAGLDRVDKLIVAGEIHGDQGVGLQHQGGADGLVADADGAVGRAAAHLGAVAGEPGDLAALHEARVGRDLTGEEQALAAEAGQNEIQIPAVAPRITSTWGVLLGSLLSGPAPVPHPSRQGINQHNTARVRPLPSEKMLVVGAS